MAALLRLAQSPWPLPLGGLKARRSLLSLDNLTSATDTVLRAEGPLRRPFIVADPEPVTVPEIVAALRAGLGRSPGLIPVPAFALKGAALLAGKAEAYERLAGSLVASPEALMRLGWQPVSSTPDGLARLARQAAAAPGA
jgi:UDP-glucose 4-epimerase